MPFKYIYKNNRNWKVSLQGEMEMELGELIFVYKHLTYNKCLKVGLDQVISLPWSPLRYLSFLSGYGACLFYYNTLQLVFLYLVSFFVCLFGYQSCERSEPVNGKPRVPIINDGTLPKFLQAKRLENAVSRNNSRLKIFTGTANPSLSQVNQTIVMCIHGVSLSAKFSLVTTKIFLFALYSINSDILKFASRIHSSVILQLQIIS